MGVTGKVDTTTFQTGQYCSLPIITIFIDGNPYQALLDCGASLSLCTQSAVKRMSSNAIEHIHTNPNIKISSVSGENIKITKSLKINFSVGSKQLKHPILITDTNLGNDYDIILGFDFLKRFQCQINFATQSVLIGKESTPINRFDYGKINVIYVDNFGKLTHKLKLFPGQSSVVEVKLNNHVMPGSEVLVEPLLSQHNIEIHNSVTTVNKNGTISFVINNLSQNNMHLNKNSKIVRVDADIDLKEDKRQARRQELTAEHFDLKGVPMQAKQKLLDLIFEYADIFSVSLQTIGECTIEAPPIEITDYMPIQNRPFPIPVALRDNVRSQIEELQSAGILEKSNSQYAFPLILVRKKTQGEYRDIIDTINTVSTDIPDIDVFKSEQRKDPNLRKIIDYLENKTDKSNISTDSYFMDKGMLKKTSYRQKRSAREDYLEQIVVPTSLIPHVLEGSETVHYAFFKIYRSIQEKYYWKNMYKDIKNFSASCKKCIEKKGFKLTKSQLQNFETPSQPMELLSLDISSVKVGVELKSRSRSQMLE
ncbi:hypothetical protein JTE90_003079 [Oedothorax gibbosus]|uniref:RNA-directed DNA polymerase n=1 Tax=Oedothorax gibbosus TaxID=931172 RepID=A0AAV6TR75_9ARAC|nr:hypothetical protein JTE90_003079 [Oedothorax gibbosus]